jgi:hypothetical protein
MAYDPKVPKLQNLLCETEDIIHEEHIFPLISPAPSRKYSVIDNPEKLRARAPGFILSTENESSLDSLFRYIYLDEVAHEKRTVITDNFCHGRVQLNTRT